MWIALIVVCSTTQGCITLGTPPLQSKDDCLVAIYDQALTLPMRYPNAASIDAWCVPLEREI